MRISIGALRGLIDAKHDGNVSAAAHAWGLEQSHLCRVLKAERTLRPNALRRIARTERVNPDPLVEAERPTPGLRVLGKDRGFATRLAYDVNDPGSMLLQVESWFADVPNKDGMRTHLIRAVMRSMFDHSFDQVHKPTAQWRTAMDLLDGWVSPASRAKRRSEVS